MEEEEEEEEEEGHEDLHWGPRRKRGENRDRNEGGREREERRKGRRKSNSPAGKSLFCLSSYTTQSCVTDTLFSFSRALSPSQPLPSLLSSLHLVYTTKFPT
jgi:hypothetical protein